MREKGVPEANAGRLLAGLPETFDEWRVSKSRSPVESLKPFAPISVAPVPEASLSGLACTRLPALTFSQSGLDAEG